MSSHSTLTLPDFNFAELFNSAGLTRLDEIFLQQLKNAHPESHQKLMRYRQQQENFTSQEISELLIQCACFLEKFLANFFGIHESLAIIKNHTLSLNPLSDFKKYFVLRRAKKELTRVTSLPSFTELSQWLDQQLQTAEITAADDELKVALLGMQYLADPTQFQEQIEKLVAWCTLALATPEGQEKVKTWSSFRIPKRLDYANLVETVTHENNRQTAPDSAMHLRDGFKLTDTRMSARQIQDEINYCIYCHDHDGDFCSKGFPQKKGDPALGFKKNPLDITLTGCPLEEKISEAHFLKKNGMALGALAVIMIDNPMCPATGHRICNDCMKACIYQKQEPVNIPQIETRILTDVLHLPWGVEIYDLLTRWNPLRQKQWVMKPYNGLKVMIAGMGPAGFTLAHHLLLEGFAVVGFDGLKIENLSSALIDHPIYRYADLVESLDERLMAGFGGVAEYGITVRWDKNFLKLIYLSLMRRPYFQVFGGVRFGGTIKVEDAWEMGFDHFVIAVGAGLPKALAIPESLAPGMRQANDFLMALQLGNAAKATSLTSLQIRLPAVVIGGGLTGVDTATELQAYYIRQVEKVAKRYAILVKKHGEKLIQQQLDDASREILKEYLQHASLIQAERDRAKSQKEKPNFIKLLHAWGGVTIAYRRTKQKSPAYIHNHEELQKALQEGVFYLEEVDPLAVELDEYGHTKTLLCHDRLTNKTISLPARAILVATGTQPNIAYEFEHRGTFKQQGLQYLHFEDEAGDLTLAEPEHCKEKAFGPFTSYKKQDYRVSLIGDTHPLFHGSVVKAIASGMRTYPKILDLLQDKLLQQGDEKEYQLFVKNMQNLFAARIQKIARKTAEIFEITIKAPIATKHFEPGNFYRLQNFETHAPTIENTLCQLEPLALYTAECDKQNGEITFIVRENSAAAKMATILQTGEAVSLMGPTGVRAKIPDTPETILIIGNEDSFAFVRSYACALRAKNHRVLYVALLRHKEEVYCQTQLENATDAIVWMTKSPDKIAAKRPQDAAIVGDDLVAALCAYEENSPSISLQTVQRIFVIGNPNLLRQFQHARRTALQKYLQKNLRVFGSVHGNMQCMLKGVCAQCLQWQIDPQTGERTKAVFACSWQDQPLEIIDIDHIDARRAQNQLLDKLNQLWVHHLFAENRIPRI